MFLVVNEKYGASQVVKIYSYNTFNGRSTLKHNYQKIESYFSFLSKFLQLIVLGMNGANGQPAMQPVVEALKCEEGLLTLWQNMVAQSAQDTRKRFELATLSAVLVR